jgi:hypothetical protein
VGGCKVATVRVEFIIAAAYFLAGALFGANARRKR